MTCPPVSVFWVEAKPLDLIVGESRLIWFTRDLLNSMPLIFREPPKFVVYLLALLERLLWNDFFFKSRFKSSEESRL